jgi:glycosyltransferase involved in cell wall biosynthesis
MRVLHVIHDLDSRGGGTVMAMSGLCKAQRAAGIEVSALATFPHGSTRDAAASLEQHGVPATLIGPSLGPTGRHRHLVSTARALIQQVDIVHAHGVWEEIQHVAARQAAAQKKPFVISPHGMLSSWSRGQKWLKKRIYLALRLRRDLTTAAAIHFATGYERDLTAGLGLSVPTIVEPLGIDLSEFKARPPPGALRAKFPQLQGRRIIMYLGRVDRAKGLEYLVPAMAALTSDNAMLVAVGPDWRDFRPKIEKMIDEYGVRDRVLFTGMLRGREKLEALVDADLFALPSEHENFGIVVIEALACGVPVIVSDHVALAGEVRVAQVGAVVPTGDVPALARELDHWMADEKLRRSASNRARPFVWNHFDWTRIGQRWVEHYQTIVSAPNVVKSSA